MVSVFLGDRALPILQEEIRACRKCEEAGYIAEARPLTRGTADTQVFIVGQAPSRTDHESGGMYLGPAGRKLRSWFVQAGFEEADFGTRIYFAAITKCFPGRKPGMSTDRLPSRAEQALCRPWLDAELAVVQPPILVLFGGLAIATFLSRAPLAELVGNVYEAEGRTVIPFPHSSGASTWLNASENQEKLAQAIEQLRVARLSLGGSTHRQKPSAKDAPRPGQVQGGSRRGIAERFTQARTRSVLSRRLLPVGGTPETWRD